MAATFTLKLRTYKTTEEIKPEQKKKTISAYQPYTIPYAHSELHAGPQATIFLQSLERYSYCMELFLYEVKQRLSLSTVVEKPAVIFCYALNGRVRSLHKGPSKVSDLQAGYYAGYSLPAGEYRLQLPRGVSAFFYFTLEQDCLTNIMRHLPNLSELIMPIRTSSYVFKNFPLCKIDFGVKKVIKQMQNCSSGNFALDLSLLSGAWNLLSIYEDRLQARKEFADKTSAEVAREVHEFIQQHFSDADQVQLPLLANRFHIAEKTLSRTFKNVFGVSIHQLIIELRMDRAVSLLKGTSHPINEVAARCGYPDIYRFSRAFKNFYGFSPRQAKNRKI